MTLSFQKYLQICAIYAYHMNGTLKFNLSGNGITWRKVLYIKFTLSLYLIYALQKTKILLNADHPKHPLLLKL